MKEYLGIQFLSARSSKRKRESAWVKKPLDELEKDYDPAWLAEKVVAVQTGEPHPQDTCNFQPRGYMSIRCKVSQLSTIIQHFLSMVAWQDPTNPKKMLYSVYVGATDSRAEIDETGQKVKAKARIAQNKAMRAGVAAVLTTRAAERAAIPLQNGGTGLEPRRKAAAVKKEKVKKERTEEQEDQARFQKECGQILNRKKICKCFELPPYVAINKTSLEAFKRSKLEDLNPGQQSPDCLHEDYGNWNSAPGRHAKSS